MADIKVSTTGKPVTVTPKTTSLSVKMGGKDVRVDVDQPNLLLPITGIEGGTPGPPGPQGIPGVPQLSNCIASQVPVVPGGSGTLTLDAPPVGWAIPNSWAFLGSPVQGYYRVVSVSGNVITFTDWTPA